MEKPKCKLCGERHWGACGSRDNAQAPRADYGRSPAVDALEGVKATNALPPEVRAKAAAAVVEKRPMTIAPPGECPYCDARRENTAAAVRLHRAKRSERKIT